MKIRNILTAALCLISSAAFAQSDYDVSKDAENGAVVFKGQCSFADLQKEPSFSWFAKGEADYKPDTNAVAYLKQHLKDYELVILMGTWCDDSQNLLPKLHKALTDAGYPVASVKMYGVDRSKQTKYIEHKAYSLEKVPTIIVTKNNGEVGRIVENVKKNIETDLVQIIKAK